MAKSKILVLGGTQMLGRDFVETLLEKDIDYDLALANRGITNSELFNNLSKIQIDRNIESECNKLNNSQYDYVIDFSCYTIDQFKNTINNLKYKKYIYISTMSVFDQNTINKILSACPDYDLTGLVKKSVVSDVCYGCDNP
jgi:nucleoside-diphosphate-sugar epimerase